MQFNFDFSQIRGEWFSLASALFWSVSTVLYRVYGNSTRPAWITIYKGVVAIALLAITVIAFGGFTAIGMPAYLALAISGIIGISLGDTAFFAALPKIGGSLTSAIQCVAPLLTTVGAIFFLNESIDAPKALAILVSSVAIAVLILIERPKDSGADGKHKHFRTGILLALAAAICQAIGVLISRKPLEGLSPAEGAVHRMLVSVLVVLFWESFSSKSSVVKVVEQLWNIPYRWQMTMAAITGTYLGLMAMVYGMTHAPVGVAIAINSSYPIWVTLIEILFLKKKFNPLGFFCLICGVAGLFFLLPLK